VVWERAAWWLGLTVKLSKARRARRALSVRRLGPHALPPARRSLERCSAAGRGCAGQRARSGWRYKVRRLTVFQLSKSTFEEARSTFEFPLPPF